MMGTPITSAWLMARCVASRSTACGPRDAVIIGRDVAVALQLAR